MSWKVLVRLVDALCVLVMVGMYSFLSAQEGWHLQDFVSTVSQKLVSDPTDCASGEIAVDADNQCNLTCAAQLTDHDTYLIGGADEGSSFDRVIGPFAHDGRGPTSNADRSMVTPMLVAGRVTRMYARVARSPSSTNNSKKWEVSLLKNDWNGGTIVPGTTCTIQGTDQDCEIFFSPGICYDDADRIAVYFDQTGARGSLGKAYTLVYEEDPACNI